MYTHKQLKVNIKGFFSLVLLWVALPLFGQTEQPAASDSLLIVPVQNDSTLLVADSVSSSIQQDSTMQASSDSLIAPPPAKKSPIDAEIKYSAQDSIVFLANGTGFLYGQGDVTYKTMNLKAEFIRVKMDSSTIYAKGVLDSIGDPLGDPVFTEKGKEYSSKEMTYNLKTRKAFVKHAVTQEGEGYIVSENTKMTDDDLICMTGGKYTTCDNHEHPHFYLSLSRAKVAPGKFIASGPAHLVVADVPLPLVIPFGFFPFTNDYSSGLLMPSYADDLSRGFGLINGGYYFAISDYVDLELRTEFYTKGTWAASGVSSYLKRYKYRGSFQASYREDVTGEKDMPDYAKSKNLSVRWNHSQDAKANPYATFSASVNFSTSGYHRSNINSYYNPSLNSENTKSSSVSFTKRFPTISSLSISGNVLVSQQTRDSTISATLPNITIAYSSTKPFKRKNAIGNERWYEKITMSYSGTMSNSISTKENLLLSSSLVKDWRNGMKHSIPISATYNLLNYINITPSISYTERWYTNSVQRSWDTENQIELADTTYGFHRVYDFSTGVSASTKIYGFYIPIRKLFGDKVDRFRHVVTPTFGFSYTPDFGEENWDFYRTYVKYTPDPSNPGTYKEQDITYSRYSGSLYGSPGKGLSQSLNFSLSNNLEMKVRNDKDTTGKAPFRVISLIDQFSVSGSYNMAADSMNWSNFSTSLRIKLFKNYTLSLSGAFDPYLYGLTEPTSSNSKGSPVRINELRWNHGKFPKFLGTSTSYSYTLNNDTFKKLFNKSSKTSDTGNVPPDDEANPDENVDLDGLQETTRASRSSSSSRGKAELDDEGYEKVRIPWSINISYSVRYLNKDFNYDKMEYDMGFKHNFDMSGSISLGDNWSASSSLSYDFQAKEISYTSVSVSRKLHCFNMSASFVPFGRYKSYTFHIGAVSSMLSDLKYDKRSQTSGQIEWY